MVIIPIAKERFEQSELSAEDNNAPSEIQSIISIPEEPFKPKQYNALQIDKKQILIVEDNDELRSFLSDQLSGLYLVIEASNGIDALKKANEYNPEIIISDIMMPEMDGIELCSLIKNQVETSHIPVILLTAKADIESKLEGLRTGADDYLTKPFNGDELIVRIENLLRQREKLKDKFLTYPLSEIPGLHTGSSDKEFISEMLEIIKNNLDKSDFSTDQLASALNLGKRTFQRKTKALTRLTPVELIRVVRIKYAAQLLTGKTLTVAEAAYATGFSSVSYFTKSFKEVMGVNPSDYIK
jgi:DNA-binding response OmpR family regulator